MSDLHGGHGGARTDGPAGPTRRGRRVRPGAVPDARPEDLPEDLTGEQPAVAADPQPVPAPQPVAYDRDAVFDLESAPPAGRPEPVEEPQEVLVEDLLPDDHGHPDEPLHEQIEQDEHVEHDEHVEYVDEYADVDEYEHDVDGHEDHVALGVIEHDEHDGYDDPAAVRRHRRRRRGRSAVVLLVCLALLGGAVYAGWSFLSPIVSGIADGNEAEDFAGPGTGEVDVVVQPGDTGGAIGETLAAAGVVASRAAFVAEFTANPAAATLQPGTYRLRNEMKASDALALLLDPASRQSIRVGVREGLWVSETLAVISEETGFTTEELTTALADPAIGLPAEAGGNAEGYLFPATYDFPPDVTPVQVLTAMVARHAEAMAAVGVPAEDQREVLIRASIIQAEVGRPEDLGKVSRVIQNRLDRGETLGMDSTVGYVVQKRVFDLSATDLATDSPYNTRINTGLPPGPIDSPGEAAIAAALAPTEGDWLYFVTVDGDTGETVFTADYDEFLAAKAQYQEWLAANP